MSPNDGELYLYPLNATPELIARLMAERDDAVADTLLRGRCAAPSILPHVACHLPYGHTGKHDGCGWVWE